MKKLVVDATIENTSNVLSFIDEELERLDCNLIAKTKLDVAVDEIFSNIANYAYEGKGGKATIVIDYVKDDNKVIIKFVDEGVPYNPLEKEDPDITLPIEKRVIGGLGILIVKKSMDNVTYEYKDNKNILIIEKII